MKVTTSIGKQGSGGTWEQRMLGIDFTKTANTPPKYTLYLPMLSRPFDLARLYFIFPLVFCKICCCAQWHQLMLQFFRGNMIFWPHLDLLITNMQLWNYTARINETHFIHKFYVTYMSFIFFFFTTDIKCPNMTL